MVTARNTTMPNRAEHRLRPPGRLARLKIASPAVWWFGAVRLARPHLTQIEMNSRLIALAAGSKSPALMDNVTAG